MFEAFSLKVDCSDKSNVFITIVSSYMFSHAVILSCKTSQCDIRLGSGKYFTVCVVLAEGN